nr:hypothetical protein [Tanacetum cinerariifolium]
SVQTYTRRRRAVSTGSGRISTASKLFSTAEESVSTTSALMPVSTTGMAQEVNIPSPVTVKDKDKEWENIRVRVEADEELAQRLQAGERNKYNEVDQAKMLVDLINQRKIYFATQKVKAKRNKPMNQAQHKAYMSNIPSLTARDDLVMLWSLVKKRFSLTEPTDDKERTLWVELKRLFELDTDDTLWNLQRYMHDPLTWRLYDTCGVYRVSKEKGMDIFMLVEKEYPLSKGILSLMLVKKLLVDQYSEMANELLRKIFIQASRPKLYSVWTHPLSTDGLI